MADYRRTRYEKVYWRGDTLYYRLRDERGKWLEIRYGEGSPRDAADARRIAQERADAIRSGVLDPAVEARQNESKRSCEEHRDEYLEHLGAKGDGAKHRAWVRSYITRCLTATQAVTLGDLTASRIVRWLGAFTGARSFNAAMKTIRQWLSWCVDTGRLAWHPLPKHLAPHRSEGADRKRPSRAMTEDETRRLLALKLPARRRLAYLLALRAGLRWSEIGRLEWRHVDLEQGWLDLPASVTKTKAGAVLPLAPDLIAALTESKEKSGLVCCPVPRLRTWRRDLDRAGIDYGAKSAIGAVHRKAARLTFGTHLALAGVELRRTQRLMRHSDPKLTATVYTDPALLDLAGEVGKLSTIFQRDTAESSRNETYPATNRKRQKRA